MKHLKRQFFISSLLALISFFLFGPATAFAANYYVSPSGLDTNPGTLTSPWKTISKATKTVVAGDTVNVMAGTYKEGISPINKGSLGKEITYTTYNGAAVVLNGVGAIDSSGKAAASGIYANGSDSYLVFRGFEITGFTDGVNLELGANHITLDGIKSHDNKSRGIKVKGTGPSTPTTFITITNCETYNNPSHGIFIDYAVYDTKVIGNKSHHNGVWGVRDSGYGIEISDLTNTTNNLPKRIQVINNDLYHNATQGVRTWNAQDILIKGNRLYDNGATGVQLENGSLNIMVENNISYNNARFSQYETGIWVDDTTNAVVRNNILYGNERGLAVGISDQVIMRNNLVYDNTYSAVGVNATGVEIKDSKNIWFFNNTVWRNSQTAGNQKTNFSMCGGTITNAAVLNNIFSESVSAKDALFTGTCTNYTANYNNYYQNPSVRALSFNWAGATKTWATYKTASGQDANSVTTDPLFANKTNADFSLLAGSPNIDAGGYLTTTTGAGNGTVVPVANAKFFTDGMNLSDGDLITIGSEKSLRIMKVDYVANTLTINRSISWSANAAVSLDYMGNKPDIGALEYGSSSTTSTTPTTTTTPTQAIKKTGDANEDNLVDDADFSIFQTYYLHATTQGPKLGDFNSDTQVDGTDYVLWYLNFGK